MRILDHRGADRFSGSGKKRKCVGRYARVEQELRRAEREQRRLLRGLGKHGVACGKCGRDLAGVDRQRKIPRTDAHENAASVKRELVGFPGGGWKRQGLGEMLARKMRVIAAEIRGFANFADRIGARFSSFAREQDDKLVQVALDEIGRTVEHRGPRRPARRVPRRLRCGCAGKGCLDLRLVGIDNRADHALQIRGIDDFTRKAFHARAADQRCRRPFPGGVRRESIVQRCHRLLVREAHAARVDALRNKQVARKRQHGIRRSAACTHARHGIGDDVVDRNRGVRDAVDKRGVGSVFEQPAHQIGKQVLVTAHWRIDPAGDAELFRRDDRLVHRIAHPVQPLEFEFGLRQRNLVCTLDNRRGGVRIVRREHGIERLRARRCSEHAMRAREIRHVGVRLAREHRVIFQTLHLCALDLGIPVRSLDQPHRNPQTDLGVQRGEPVDHCQRAFLVPLDREAQPFPAAQGRIAPNASEDFQGKLEALGFLGVDGHSDLMRPGDLREARQRGDELGEHARPLRDLIARVQRRQLDRNARLREHAGA